MVIIAIRFIHYAISFKKVKYEVYSCINEVEAAYMFKLQRHSSTPICEPRIY